MVGNPVPAELLYLFLFGGVLLQHKQKFRRVPVVDLSLPEKKDPQETSKMNRRGRKSKTPAAADESSNGVAENADQNGQSSEETAEREASPVEEKKQTKKGRKRKSEASPQKSQTEEEPEESQYEVEAILDDKNIRGVKHYLIRWKGYEPESDTWEPESTLNCPELIQEYKAKQKKKAAKTKGKASSSTSSGADKNDKGEESWDENEDFEVDRILDVYFKKNGKREFLVSWKGYPPSQNSWEPEENMSCKDLIVRFMSKVEKAKQAEPKELRLKRTHTDRFTLSMGQSGRRLSKRNQGKQRVQYHEAE